MNFDKGKVSVILPLYNAESFICQTVESLLKQSYSDFEILAIDDCPEDKTIELFLKYKDARIKIFHNEQNMGVSYSRNRGITEASGEYIVFMDHDDIAPNDKLLNQVHFLQENTSVDAVGGRIQNIDSDSNITGTFNPTVLHNPKFIRASLMFGNMFINSSMMYRASVVKENNIQFREKSYGLEDWLFLLEFSKKGNISGINKDVLYYRRHENNTEKKILATQLEQRAKRYSEIRKFAFHAEGFELTEDDYFLLDRVFVENPALYHVSLSFKDMGCLCFLLDKLVKQAQCLSLPNKEELIIAFRKNLAARLRFVS